MTSKVYEFVTYFVAMCNDKAYFSAAKYVMCIEGCATAVIFALEVGGDNIITCAS